MDPQHGLKLDLVLRGLWELLKSLNKGIPCYGLTRNFLVGRLGAILGGFWMRLGVSWGRLGASWGHLGASWGRLLIASCSLRFPKQVSWNVFGSQSLPQAPGRSARFARCARSLAALASPW